MNCKQVFCYWYWTTTTSCALPHPGHSHVRPLTAMPLHRPFASARQQMPVRSRQRANTNTNTNTKYTCDTGQTRNKLLEQWMHLTNRTAGHSRPGTTTRLTCQSGCSRYLPEYYTRPARVPSVTVTVGTRAGRGRIRAGTNKHRTKQTVCT